MLKVSVFVAFFSVALLAYLQCIFIVQMPERKTAKFSQFKDIQEVKYFDFKDGRTLAYTDDDDSSSSSSSNSADSVLFVFPGTPGSRLFRHPDSLSIQSQFNNKKFRIITFDRFNVGFSSPLIVLPPYLTRATIIGDNAPEHRVYEWPHIIKEFADALNISSFSVAGFSTGAPYALAVAQFLPDRVKSVFLISGVVHSSLPITLEKHSTALLRTFGSNSRYNLLYRVLSLAPNWLPRYVIKYMSLENLLSAPKPVLSFLKQISSANKHELQLLETEKWSAMLTDTIVEFYRNHTRGHSDDIIALTTLSQESAAWLKLVSTITTTTPIHVYHGKEDALVDVTVVADFYRELQSQYGMPNVHLHLLQNYGHFGTFAHSWEDVLAKL